MPFPAGPRARRTPFDRLRRSVAVLAVLLAACIAAAEVVAVESTPAVWLEPTASGVVALLADGTVVDVGTGGKRVVARGWTSEELWSCGGTVWGVDRSGRLAATDGRTGPAVSAYSTPACLPGGDLVALAPDARTIQRLDADLEVVASAPVEALADTGIRYAGPPRSNRRGAETGVVVLLVEPTFRYRHGALGDEVEASGIAVLDAEDLRTVATYRVAPPAVVEQRASIPFRLGSRQGFYVTRSTPDGGAAVLALELVREDGRTALRRMAAGPAVGTRYRWLNLFAAREDRAYAVRTPHLGGPLERYRLTGSGLAVERFDIGVTNHVFGSRNVALANLLPTPGPTDWLVLPTRGLHRLRIVACADTCRVHRDLRLTGRLHSNVAATGTGASVTVWAADDGGAVHRFDLDLDEHVPDVRQGVR